jgi:hypothetical protein
MVYGGHLTIVPSDRDCIPAHFCDTAAVSGIASPINAAALLEAFGFGGSHRPPPYYAFASSGELLISTMRSAYPHDVYGVADHVGGSLLAFRASGHGN